MSVVVMLQPFPGEGNHDLSRGLTLGLSSPCRLFKVLKPGGQLLITDYCCTADRPSPEFDAYIRDRGYKLLPIEVRSCPRVDRPPCCSCCCMVG